MMRLTANARNSRFLIQPNRTILYLSLPILLSLIAEPVTGLVDTGFVAQLGTAPLASLTVGAGALTSLFWIFGFLGIATQTEVAQAFGKRDLDGAVRSLSLILTLGAFVSLALSGLLIPAAELASRLLGAEGEVLALAGEYIRLRLIGAPAVVITIVGFGALRGVQDMKTPLWIALGINITNILLDYALIFGWAFLPALGVGGAALASSLSQWLGACWMLREIRRKIGLTQDFRLRDGIKLMRVSRDLFIRTGSLTLFTLVATRVATQMGAEAGAAHQVIRQFWFFTALVLEAFATTAQSLIGYFYGSGQMREAKRVALSTTAWSLTTGILLMILMLLAAPLVAESMVPDDAGAVFAAAWIVAALSQPLNALAFITDGIHWGTSDYGFLRNAMLMATVCGLLALQAVATALPADFTGVWLATVLWIGIRAFWGVLRVFPGIGNSPFRWRVLTE
ncbi:MAG: MATE family efflux transporter [Chloroflexota bacterium]|nr:MATE family efflux transporter [Chloroflexota bacterium]